MKPPAPAILEEQAARHALVETFAAALSSPTLGAAARPALAHFALRAALDPLLAPFRADPLLTLGDRFISLDAQIAGLVAAQSLAVNNPAATIAPPVFSLSPDDRAALALLPLPAPPAPTPSILDATGAVGTVMGALYLPAHDRAAPCRLWAVYGATLPTGAAPAAWPAPVAVRAVSPDVAASAQAALVAALQTLEAFGVTARRALPPATMYYDVCAPDTPDAVCASVAGPSLGLPLALAFLSALLQIPLPLSLAATGDVGGAAGVGNGIDLARVFPVGGVARKAACLENLAALFLVPFASPAPSGDLGALPEQRGVETVAAAARVAAPALAVWFAPETPGGADGRNDVSGRLKQMTAPPVGEQVCFLVAGIEDAARLWEADADGMNAALTLYDRLALQTLGAYGGYVLPQRIGAMGDGACAAFADSHAACRAAIALLRALRAHIEPQGRAAAPPPVRVGLHFGPAPYLGGGAVTGRGGATLNRAVLLMEAARAGQILVSGAVADEAGGANNADGADAFEMREHGVFRLPDLDLPVRIAQVWADGLADVRAAPRGLDARRHNLPVQANPTLWGRDADTVRACELLLQTRLLTLTGPGGVGKTRLALQAAARSLDYFPGGVWLVPVGEIASEAALGDALADALGAHGRMGSGETRAASALARVSGRVLLVLDECEAAIDTVAAVVTRLLDSSNVTILATSQMPLLLAAEQRFDVAPLAPPPAGAPSEVLRNAPVVVLFLERARAVAPAFSPIDADLASIRSICERLDGLPLAVELAAARVRQMTPHEIEARLSDALDLLTSRLRDAAPRHRAIEATLSWSWDLLTAEEKKALARLSVFGRDGFTREAGCVLIASATVSPFIASDLLNDLEEKSLLTLLPPTEDEAGRRFVLRNLVRAFAQRRLAERGRDADEVPADTAHAAYFAALAARLGPAENTPTEVDAFNALDAEMENLRAAFAFLREEAPADLPLLVALLTDFLRRRGHQSERDEWIRAAVALLETGESERGNEALRARLLHAQGVAHNDARRSDDAERCARESLDLSLKIGDNRARGDALNLLGLVFGAAKRPEMALPCHEEALAAYREAGWARGQAASLHNIALALLRSGNRDRAQAVYEESLPLSRASGDRHGLGYALINLAHIAQENGDLATARRLFDEALPVVRDLKDTSVVAIALANLGDVMDEQGESHAAAPLLVAGEEIMARLAHHHQAEFTKYVERCAGRIGGERIAVLRAEAARLTLPALRATAPAPPPRHLNAAPPPAP